MKKILIYAMTMLCMVASISACHKTQVPPTPIPTPNPKPEPKPDVPPVVEDILATYTADKLKLTVEGAEAGTQPKVEVLKGSTETSVNMRLHNIVPDNAEYTVKDVKFESATKSIYFSKLTGETTDNVIGYKVVVNGNIDEGVLTLTVKVEKIEGQAITNASDLYSTYKGNMQVSLSGSPAGDPTEQRVYASEAKENKESSLKLAIRNFAFSGMEVGDIDFDNVPVVKRGDVYVFEVADREITVNVGGQSMTLIAQINGTIIEKNMVLSVDLAGQGLEINVAFDGNAVTENTTAAINGYTFENGDAIIEQKGKGKSVSLFFWDDTTADQLLITVTPELSEGASIAKLEGYYNSTTNVMEQGKAIDFSLFKGENDYIRYTVQAEDPSVTATYIVYPEWLKSIPLSYDFAALEWIPGGEGDVVFAEPEGWATSNAATSLLKLFTDENDKPLCPLELTPVSKNDENAAKIITIDTKGADLVFTYVPAITAGTLYLGKFEVDISNTLKSTKFGVPFKSKPVTFKGEYRFTPGPTYYKTKVEETADGKVVSKELVPGVTDKCSINAMLYEVNDYDETLDGTNANTSDKIVAVALLPDGSEQAAYTTFDIPFTYLKEYQAGKKYKLAITCSSSAKGDSFEGAPESELYVKKLSVEVE